jgi:hypothetical protein
MVFANISRLHKWTLLDENAPIAARGITHEDVVHSWAETIRVLKRICKEKILHTLLPTPGSGGTLKSIYVFARLSLLLEQEKSLPGLPFLIRKLSCGGLEKVMIVRNCRVPVVQHIIGCSPKEVCRCVFWKIL